MSGSQGIRTSRKLRGVCPRCGGKIDRVALPRQRKAATCTACLKVESARRVVDRERAQAKVAEMRRALGGS